MRLILSLLTFVAASAIYAAVEQTDVFVSGRDGYHTYRIPAIIRAQDGTLLAFAEGRKSGGGDAGDIDLLLKRSRDGGKTWDAQQVIWDDAANTCGNPCPVVDAKTGLISLLLTQNPGTARERDIDAGKSAAGTRTVWLAHSADHGATWTKPTEITASTKDPAWRWYATGPGIGIQIKAGPHAGRLVVPCDHSYEHGAATERGAHAIYSDDGGRTWKRGEPIRPQMNECQVVELSDDRGTLLMDMRSYRGRSRRAQSTSTDGGITWTEPKDAPALVEPICQASIVQWEGAGAAKRGLLLFSNPADAKTRINLTVRASEDNAATWPRALRLHAGPSAYSSLVALGPNEAGCLYECGEKRAYERIVFA
ncbi:MAG TPA: sialidase family protein, partial [Opitutaceae bacterium]|nr:sialidase family protein [Opitutaceae bacterium]